MKIEKVRFSEHTPGMIEHYCVAFLTRSGRVIIVESILNERGDTGFIMTSNEAMRIAKDVIKGKKRKVTIPLGPPGGVLVMLLQKDEIQKIDHDETLDSLADMGKAGEFLNAIVIENIPDSADELQHFAAKVLTEASK